EARVGHIGEAAATVVGDGAVGDRRDVVRRDREAVACVDVGVVREHVDGDAPWIVLGNGGTVGAGHRRVVHGCDGDRERQRRARVVASVRGAAVVFGAHGDGRGAVRV